MLLIGCVTTVENEYAAPEGIPHARIRVHHSTHAKVYLAPSCDEEPISFDASVSYLLSGFIESNKTIGMPPTKLASGLFLKYREYTIPAGYRTRVELDYFAASQTAGGAGVHYTCKPVSFSFIPDAGKDYDAHSYTSGNRCYVSIRELTKGKNEGDMATGKQIENDLPPCPRKETQKAATK